MGSEGDEGGGGALFADSAPPEVWSLASHTYLCSKGLY